MFLADDATGAADRADLRPQRLTLGIGFEIVGNRSRLANTAARSIMYYQRSA